MEDSKFKELKHKFGKGYQRIKLSGKYNPDVVAVNSTSGKAIIIESSSTGDRKVNIGEMFQADKWLRDEGYRGILIIVLDGKGDFPSTCKEQKKRLLPLFSEYLKNSKSGLHKVLIVTQNDYNNVQYDICKLESNIPNINIIGEITPIAHWRTLNDVLSVVWCPFLFFYFNPWNQIVRFQFLW
ncbi:hypothetical protein [Peribacillus asahii]|uniref:hypothetical protein n=1 Tax=Peribacillus asahii TaxID=228899 RepID=UPI0020798094|nr:hypothetical protein [Peribacillus asahii]USK61645.1 hypothetical protein LIT37_10170 [Peribacillus asahii]